ncbi:MAG TPA: aminopeptidase, partial [Candidatus Binataceae bacterium]|nr:aminopeptidase [Candidatus Binataceae bacterium]
YSSCNTHLRKILVRLSTEQSNRSNRSQLQWHRLPACDLRRPLFEFDIKLSQPGRLLLLAVLALSGAMLLAGCDLRYFAHAAYEEGHLLWNRQPIADVLQKPDLSPAIRERLETVLAVRKFASDDLGLRVGGAYRTITSVDENAVVWVVMAAPRDSLTPYLWWFPIVGYVPYKGYFKRLRAQAEAHRLEKAGYDTLVRPAIAFSSLGFFNDPVLSNLLELNRVELAGVLIHELFHRTYFLKSDVMFDESSANWIGNRGAMDFFDRTEGANSRDAIAARAIYDSDMKFAAFLLQAESKLLKLYQSGLPHDQILKRRPAVFAEIQADYARLKPNLSGLERFNLDKQQLNNAVLLNYMIYFHDLDNFTKLERMHNGDTRATIKSIIKLAKSEPADPFHAIWKATWNSRPDAGTTAANTTQ